MSHSVVSSTLHHDPGTDCYFHKINATMTPSPKQNKKKTKTNKQTNKQTKQKNNIWLWNRDHLDIKYGFTGVISPH